MKEKNDYKLDTPIYLYYDIDCPNKIIIVDSDDTECLKEFGKKILKNKVKK